MKNTGATASRALPTPSTAIDAATVRSSSPTSPQLLHDMVGLLRKLRNESSSLSRRVGNEFRFEFGRGPNAEEIAMAAAMGDY